MTLTRKRELATLDEWFPPRGPCAFCGHEDARHRLWDTILDSADDDATTAWAFDVPVEAVRAVRAVRPYQDEPRRR